MSWRQAVRSELTHLVSRSISSFAFQVAQQYAHPMLITRAVAFFWIALDAFKAGGTFVFAMWHYLFLHSHRSVLFSAVSQELAKLVLSRLIWRERESVYRA